LRSRGTEKYFRHDFHRQFPSSAPVLSVRVGFMGDASAPANPSYRAVCGGDTGHVEVAEIVYDADKTKYEDLVKFYFMMHDPTTADRQGNDQGTQYASVIFTTDGSSASAGAKTGDDAADGSESQRAVATRVIN